jgi:hypothetical protein
MTSRIYSSVTSTVTACECTEGVAAPTGYAAPSGVAAPSVASTGVVTAPTATGSPITYSNGGSVKGASAIGMIVAGGVALVSSPASFSLYVSKLTFCSVPINYEIDLNL